MAERIEFEIKLNKNVKDLEDAGSKIGEAISRSLSKLGLGGYVESVSMMKSGGSAVTAGAAGGAVAGGIMMLVELLKDFPMVAAIMKILKLILMLLLLPLIPILKPVLIALSQMAKGLVPVMKELSKATDKLVAGDFFKQGLAITWAELAIAWEMIKRAGQWVWDTIVAGFSFLVGVGLMIWTQILQPAFNYLANVGVWIWTTILQPAFNWFKNIGETIWTKILKPAWDWFKDIGEKIWDIIKSPFEWLAEKVMSIVNSIKSFLGIGKKQSGGLISQEGPYILHRGERVISATERKASSGNSTINISINNPVIKEEKNIRDLVRELESRLNKDLRRRVSYV